MTFLILSSAQIDNNNNNNNNNNNKENDENINQTKDNFMQEKLPMGLVLLPLLRYNTTYFLWTVKS